LWKRSLKKISAIRDWQELKSLQRETLSWQRKQVHFLTDLLLQSSLKSSNFDPSEHRNLCRSFQFNLQFTYNTLHFFYFYYMILSKIKIKIGLIVSTDIAQHFVFLFVIQLKEDI
jgi:hypothetical protein